MVFPILYSVSPRNNGKVLGLNKFQQTLDSLRKNRNKLIDLFIFDLLID
jgi:hypothetical protein